MENQFFGTSAACKGCNLIGKLFLRHQVTLLGIYLHGITECSWGTGNNRNLGNRCGLCLQCGHKCMSDLMIGYNETFLRGQDLIFLLITGNDRFNTLFKICLGNELTVLTDCTERGFIDHIGKLCPRRSGSGSCNGIKIYLIRKLNLTGMYLQNFFPSF